MAAAADSLAHSHSPLALTLNAPDRRQAGRRTCALCPLLRAVRPPAHRRRAGRFTGAAMAVGAAVAAAAQVSAGEHTCAHLCAKCVRLDVLAREEAHTCANDIAALVSRARALRFALKCSFRFQEQCLLSLTHCRRHLSTCPRALNGQATGAGRIRLLRRAAALVCRRRRALTRPGESALALMVTTEVALCATGRPARAHTERRERIFHYANAIAQRRTRATRTRRAHFAPARNDPNERCSCARRKAGKQICLPFVLRAPTNFARPTARRTGKPSRAEL